MKVAIVGMDSAHILQGREFESCYQCENLNGR